jgi:hypothetical protein
MKTNKTNQLPTTEQLATLTSRLVASGIIPKLDDHNRMFRDALEYWLGCEKFLQHRQQVESHVWAARAGRKKALAAAYESVPRPAKFPAAFQWLLDNLFDGDRAKVRDYIEYCQSCGTWPSADIESFIAPLLDGVDVEAYQWLTRHWYEWRLARSKAAQREAGTKRPVPKPRKNPPARSVLKNAGRVSK